MIHHNKDEKWMKVALKYAYYAEKQGEIPIGAVLIFNERIIGIGWNSSISQNDPTAHAEIMALRYAGKRIKNYRLVDSTLYVTLQPCIMCCGAIIQSRIRRLVFGAKSKKLDDQYHLKNIFLKIQKKTN
ncbi:tRNA adenosine(34) deaminase TadA [Buchnera aphidicola]|uniref:tRNA adenosine(34) deaminase TadA n=1 Tax=Buchnera aphidicola TaxID=9 RepID=UPI003967B996